MASAQSAQIAQAPSALAPSAPALTPAPAQIVAEMRGPTWQWNDATIDNIVQQLFDHGHTSEETVRVAFGDCADHTLLMARLMDAGFETFPAYAVASAILDMRSSVPTYPQPNITLHDILQRACTATPMSSDSGDVLLRLVKAAGGGEFIPPAGQGTEKLRFAGHRFSHAGLDEEPQGVSWLLGQWNELLRMPPSRFLEDPATGNPLWVTAAAPGCGKSHFVDELSDSLSKPQPSVLAGTNLRQVICLKVSFGNSWMVNSEVESEWTVEQQLIGRVLCVACKCRAWRAFANWFASSCLMEIKLKQLVEEVLPKISLVVFLLDDPMLLCEEMTDATRATQLYCTVSELSDATFCSQPAQTRVLSLITSLRLVSSMGRPITYVLLDRLDPRVVISEEEWRNFHTRIGEPRELCIDPAALLFSMCMGHPESIAAVKDYLNGEAIFTTHKPGRDDPLEAYIMAVTQQISIRAPRVWHAYARLKFLCPVLLDLAIPGSRCDHVPLGAQLVSEGFYVNDFNIDLATNVVPTDFVPIDFVPITTAYQLYYFFHMFGEARKGIVRNIAAAVFAIRRTMTERQPTGFRHLLPAFFHLRLEAMKAAVTTLPQHFGAHVELQLHPFLFRDDRRENPYHVGLIEVHEAQTYKLKSARLELQLDTVNHTTCAGFPNADAEPLLSLDDSSITTCILAKRGGNPALDFAIHAWCRQTMGVDQTGSRRRRAGLNRRYKMAQPHGLTIFGQNKQGQRSYCSARTVRRAIHNLELSADDYLRRRQSNEMVVLLLVLLCTEADDIDPTAVMTNSKMNEAYPFTHEGEVHVLPAVRYPVVIMGRSDVARVLGSCYAHFFHGQLLANIQAEASLQAIEQEMKQKAASTGQRQRKKEAGR